MSNETQGKTAADQFRRDHSLGTGPLEDLVELLAATIGVDVLVVDAAESEHGLTMADPARGAVVMAVATTPFSARQRSSIAHELAHYLWRDDDLASRESFGEKGASETRANAFARHLLLPLESVEGAALTADEVIESAVSQLVERFDVSPHIAAIQLKEVERISVAKCAEFANISARQLAIRYGWLGLYDQRSAASSSPRSPRMLLARATEGYIAGVVSIADVAEWAGKPIDDLANEFDVAGIRPADQHEDDDIPDDPFPS